jgi:hypothetical protein
MNKQIIIIGMLVVGTFALSCYTVISNDNEMKNLSRQMYKLKQEQSTVANKIDALFDNYSAVDNALSFYEADTSMSLEQIRETLLVLDELGTTDNMLMSRLERIQDKQEVQGQELLDVREEYSATGGFGVLTGEIALGTTPEPVEVVETPIAVVEEPEPEVIVETVAEPIVYLCPSPDRSVDFGEYVSKIVFSRDTRFTVSYDIQNNTITNVVFSKRLSSRLTKAVTNYLDNSIDTTNNTTNCSIPFAIEV